MDGLDMSLWHNERDGFGFGGIIGALETDRETGRGTQEVVVAI